MNKVLALIKLLRPKQWLKNIFIFPALLFSKEFLIIKENTYNLNYDNIIITLILFFVFSLVSSCVYIINDIMDAEEDRLHPKKRHRPIASGVVSVKLAIILLFLILILAFGTSFLFNVKTQIVLLIYFILNLLYSLRLKKIPVLDIVVLASGFLLRSIAGAFVIDVIMTNWFLVCIFMISLMIGSVKRRGEFSIKKEARRSVLRLYNVEILDLFVALSSVSSLLTYCIFALTHTITYFYISIPFVIYGIMRYLYISYMDKEQSGSPDEVLTSDIHIIITGILYVISIFLSMFILK